MIGRFGYQAVLACFVFGVSILLPLESTLRAKHEAQHSAVSWERTSQGEPHWCDQGHCFAGRELALSPVALTEVTPFQSIDEVFCADAVTADDQLFSTPRLHKQARAPPLLFV